MKITKKEDLKYKIGDWVIVDYSQEADIRKTMTQKQLQRHGRMALILDYVECEEYGYGSVFVYYKYEILVGTERIKVLPDYVKTTTT